MLNRILAFVSVVLICCLWACTSAASNEDRWYAGVNTVTSTEKVLLTAKRAGWIDDQTLVHEIDPVIQASRETLAEAKKFLPDGGHEFEILMGFLEKLLIRLSEYQAAVERSLAGPDGP